MRFLFIIIFIFLLNFYVLFRLWNMITNVLVVRIIFSVLATIAVSSFFLFFIAGNIFPVWLATIIYKIGTSWFFIMLYLLMFFLSADILRLCGVKQLNDLMHANWISLISLAGMMIFIFTAGNVNYNNKKRTELTLDASSYSGINEPIRIVAISDLHLGFGIGPKEFAEWIDKINAEKPDFVFIAGDLIDNNIKPLYHHRMEELFKNIKSKHGIYMVLGNHEYISGLQNSIDFIQKAGIKLLKDSVILEEGIYIAGRDDRSNPQRKAVDQLLSGLEKNYPIILLDHQPYELENAQQSGVFLQFSGHTHRGQVWPISWITDRMYEDSFGYIKKGNTNYYVSSGLGIWGGKFRIGSRSEYVVINIKNQNK